MGVRNEEGLNEIKVVGGLLVAAVERELNGGKVAAVERR